MSETNPAPYYDDEISISELLMKLWAKRGLIVMLPLVLAGLTIVGLLMSKSLNQSVIDYFIELDGIRLEAQALSRQAGTANNGAGAGAGAGAGNEPDAELRDGLAALYPNGATFSPQDLVNPTVLKIIAADFDLDTQKLAKSVDVQFGTPISNGVLAEYRAALSENSKSSAADLAALNTRYEEKLSAAAKRGLKISVNFSKLGIDEAVGQSIAEALPKAWNRVYTEQFNTTMPSKVAGLRWTDDTAITNTAVGLQEADMRLREIEKGADIIAADGRLQGLKTASGVSASDLLGSIADFRRIFFEPVFYAAFEEESSLSRVYEQDYRLQIEALTLEIAEIDARLTDIRNFQNRAQASNTQSTANPSAQLDGSALTAVVNLAEQAALSNYLQESLDQRYVLVKEKSDLATRLARIQPRQKGGTSAVDDAFRQQAFDRYSAIISGYRALLLTAQGTLQDQIPSYYAVMTQPQSGGKLFERRDLLFIALALALGGMLAIIAALVWPKPEGAS